MEQQRRGARLRVGRKSAPVASDVQQFAVDGPPPGSTGVRLDRPNQGPPPTGPILTLAEFSPKAVAERKRREAEAQQASEEVEP